MNGLGLTVLPGEGVNQIGGSLIRLQPDEGPELLLDAGLPLFEKGTRVPLEEGFWGRKRDNKAALEWARMKKLLPDAGPGIYLDDRRESNCAGILISHPHPDHWGLLRLMKPEFAAFISPKALAYLKAMAQWNKEVLPDMDWRILDPGGIGETGGFRFKGIGVSHSAWGCLAFEIIAPGGQRIVYTGDFRGAPVGGWKQVASGVNLLISETTLLGGDEQRGDRSEADLAEWMADTLSKTGGLVSVAFSGGHPERLETLRQACAKAGRELVLDLYTAFLLQAVEGTSALDGVRILWTVRYKNRVEAVLGKDTTQVLFGKSMAIPLHEIQDNPGRYLLSLRGDTVAHAEKYEKNAGKGYAQLPAIQVHFHSLWQGYRELQHDSKIEAFLKKQESWVFDTAAHVSGHASVGDLKRLVHTIKAKHVMGVHGCGEAIQYLMEEGRLVPGSIRLPAVGG